ncbi:hypothetical protein PIIN_04092, partial [Serendipita indica DSM 11827]
MDGRGTNQKETVLFAPVRIFKLRLTGGCPRCRSIARGGRALFALPPRRLDLQSKTLIPAINDTNNPSRSSTATPMDASSLAPPQLLDYLDPALKSLDEHHLSSASNSPSRPMSPVHSAASTPPLANQTSAMTSYATPYSLSNSGYAAQAAPFPRRAEHSFPQYQMHNQAQMHNPYVYGSPQHPQPPPPPAAQRSRGPPLPTASIVHPIQTDLSSTSGPDTPLSGAAGAARKRPKYTRSKKGCLTCRSKKIKCDERKPICTRCEHGHRE